MNYPTLLKAYKVLDGIAHVTNVTRTDSDNLNL